MKSLEHIRNILKERYNGFEINSLPSNFLESEKQSELIKYNDYIFQGSYVRQYGYNDKLEIPSIAINNYQAIFLSHSSAFNTSPQDLDSPRFNTNMTSSIFQTLKMKRLYGQIDESDVNFFLCRDSIQKIDNFKETLFSPLRISNSPLVVNKQLEKRDSFNDSQLWRR